MTNSDKPKQAVIEALKKDFHNLYRESFTTDWEAERIVIDAVLDIMSLYNLMGLIGQMMSEVRRDQIGKDLGGYSYTMPIKSVRTRNTAFKLYATKFFNSKIKERRERQLAALTPKPNVKVADSPPLNDDQEINPDDYRCFKSDAGECPVCLVDCADSYHFEDCWIGKVLKENKRVQP
jgi:hypothetical protein